MRVPLAVFIAVAPAGASAVTPESSCAVILAAQTGEIIGGASVCGMPEDRLVMAGGKVIGRIRDLATSGAETARAQASHERAVRRGADQVARAGPEACRAAIDRFRALELGR